MQRGPTFLLKSSDPSVIPNSQIFEIVNSLLSLSCERLDL